MAADSLAQHLSQIATEWTLLNRAHAAGTTDAKAAQTRLLSRYGGAIRRYLLACLRSSEAADEVFQEFALRLLKGNLQGAQPERGRFRHFLKGVLFHLMADHHSKKGRQPLGLTSDAPEPAAPYSSTPEEDAAFLASWREELLAQTWKLLEAREKETGQPFFTVLAYRRDHPEQRSEEMASALSLKLSKPITAASVRQTLHRAREQFADLLLDQVVHSLDSPSVADLEDELADLQLLQYCQAALDRHRGQG